MSQIVDTSFARVVKESIVRNPSTQGALTADDIAFDSTLTVKEKFGTITGENLKAENVINIPSGGVSSGNVQLAINELDSEKANISTTYTKNEVNELVTKTGLFFYALNETVVINSITYQQTAISRDDARYNKVTPSYITSSAITGQNMLLARAVSDADVLREVGEAPISTHFQIRKVSGNADFTFYVKYYKLTNTGVSTLLGTSGLSNVISSNVVSEQVVYTTLTNASFTSTDRLMREVYFNKVGTNTDPVAEITVEGPTPTYISMSIPVTGLNLYTNSQIDGFLATKENTVNKVTTMTGNTTSNIVFLTAKALYDWAIGLFATISQLATKANLSGGNVFGGTQDMANIKIGNSLVLNDADKMNILMTLEGAGAYRRFFHFIANGGQGGGVGGSEMIFYTNNVGEVSSSERLRIARNGDLLVNSQNWTGAWTAFTPTVSGSGGGSATSFAGSGYYKVIGRLCFVTYNCGFDRSTLAGRPRIALPLTAQLGGEVNIYALLGAVGTKPSNAIGSSVLQGGVIEWLNGIGSTGDWSHYPTGTIYSSGCFVYPI